ncbi:MAG: hypothetical protein AAFY65_14080 [Pseudomonadota bacterium]
MEPRPTAAATEAQKRAWRRDRLRDGARLLPFLGVGLVMIPDLVLSGTSAAEGATLPWLVYLFAVWLLLVGLAAWIGHLRARSASDGSEDGAP